MYYEINVSQKGIHYFATAERSITSEVMAEAIVNDFRQRFPVSQGFEITCSVWQKIGKTIEFANHSPGE